MAENKKKEKPMYVDDGRTLADMTNVRQGASRYFRTDPSSYSSFREKWSTFWAVFRMMLLPTLAISGGLAVLYGVMYLLFKWM